jgi:transmembrane sensor
MSAPDQIPPLEAAALEWLLERADGFSAERARDFAAWLAADPRHAAAFARLERSHELLATLPEFREEVEAAFPPVVAPRAARSVRSWLAFGGLAAALALGAFGWSRFSGDFLAPRYATSTDARRTVTLRDGTVVELNTATRVRIQFSATERRVDLTAGEAHFSVARDAARPFVVTAGTVAVRAVGTTFNVRHAPAAVEVVVVEGQVEVKPSSASSPAAVSPAPRLQAGQRILVPSAASAPAPQVEPVDAETIRATLRWQPSLAEFDEEPLREVVARFNRRNRLQLVLAPELGDRRIAGMFALDQAEAFARLLERDGDIVAEPRGAHEIVLRHRW